MHSLYIFNPDNDLALGSGLRSYTAPLQARLLRKYGAELMSWVSSEDDFCYCDVDMLKSDAGAKSRRAKIYTPGCYINNVVPWGWSAAIVSDLIRIGVSPTLLPTDDVIECRRMLSHRRTSILINEAARMAGLDTPEAAVEYADVNDIDMNGYMKSPWSSSGRGVVDTSAMSISDVRRMASGIIRRQGSVIMEPVLDKVCDLAMLFKVEGGRVRYEGLSSFYNLNGGTAYTGNVIAPQEQIMSQVESLLPYRAGYLNKVASVLEQILSEIIGQAYEGWCGVDMMVYRRNGENALAPCIELNLRMTMGVVALELYRRHVEPGKTGRMYMRVGKVEDKEIDAATIVDGRLRRGRISLVAPNEHFNFYLEVD